MIKNLLKWAIKSGNWRWILFFSMLVTAAPFVVYQLTVVDADLRDSEIRSSILADFEKEINAIPLPPKTAVNKTAGNNRPWAFVTYYVRYRTESDPHVFFEEMDRQLKWRGWTPYKESSDGNPTTYSYCRGKYDADLMFNGSGGVWADGGEYWELNYSLGLRKSMMLSGDLPKSCKVT